MDAKIKTESVFKGLDLSLSEYECEQLYILLNYTAGCEVAYDILRKLEPFYEDVDPADRIVTNLPRAEGPGIKFNNSKFLGARKRRME